MNWSLIFYFLILITGTFAAYNKVIRAPQCLYMADIGPCAGRHRVFGYDYLTNRCVHFFYGGCGGNPNRFATRSECMSTCYVEDAEAKDEKEDKKFDLYYKDEL